jgi:hypothetical protein
MKRRTFVSVLAAVVGVLLLIGGGSGYWLLAQSPLGLLRGGAMAQPGAAMFVPKQAPAMVSLLVNPDRLEAFRQVVAQPQHRRRARAELAQLKQGFLASTGLDYEQDVQPWLGDELTLAVTTLDVDRDRSNGQQPGYLLAIATQDPERSREFLQLFWQKRALAGTDLVFEQFQGVKLIYSGEADQKVDQLRAAKAASGQNKATSPLAPNGLALSFAIPTLASAVVGDHFVLFANTPKVLRDAITNVQAPDLSLGQARFYQESLAALTQPHVGLSFVNLPGLAHWLAEPTGEPIRHAGAGPSQKSAYRTLALALGLNRQGLMAETALLAANPQTASPTHPDVVPTLTQPVAALDYIPANSPFVAVGQDLNRLWAGINAGTASYDTVAQLWEQTVATLQTQWQIDLPQDVFSWVTDTYALGGWPVAAESPKGRGKGNRSAPPAESLDWVFVTERTAKATEAIAHLDDLARRQGLSVGPVELGDHTVSAWIRLKSGLIPGGRAAKNKALANALSLQTDIRGVHATLGDYEVFATSLAAMDRVLDTQDANNPSIATNARFQQMLQSLAQPNGGVLYLDWPRSQPVLERQFPLLKVVELAGQPVFRHLQSLTLSGYGSQNGIQRGGIAIQLSRL